MNIAVFASHGGSDMQAIVDSCRLLPDQAKVSVVISNNADSLALKRAADQRIPHIHLSAKKSGSEEILAEKILEVLNTYHIDMIFLAGYLRKLHPSVVKKYENRIFNIHPALLPKYGGKGMYGMHVHQAVLEAKETLTGVTIHRVNSEYDDGAVIAQRTIAVYETDTPESLAKRVLLCEHRFLKDMIQDVVNGLIRLG